MFLTRNPEAFEGKAQLQEPCGFQGMHHGGDVAQIRVGQTLIVADVTDTIEPPSPEIEGGLAPFWWTVWNFRL